MEKEWKAYEIGELDQYLFGQGNHYEIYKKLGAHMVDDEGQKGVYFAVWAPNAKSVSVVGEFNDWDRTRNPMTRAEYIGIYTCFVPGVKEGMMYKFCIETITGEYHMKADPYANYAELRPGTASRITNIENLKWTDSSWMTAREKWNHKKEPMSVYEVHMGSWKRHPGTEDEGFYTYREFAKEITKYMKDMGYTHVEIMGIAEHPFDGSWGYQVTGYYAPTSRYGTPEDFAWMINYLHRNGIGVIMDWVPAHFPRDTFGLASFDGTCLYEHLDPRQGSHPHWGTLIYNYGRPQVKNFLIANALFWADKFHVDGIRFDAVASMLYLDYGKNDGEWVANIYGGNENLDAVEFLKHLNSIFKKKYPDALLIAEESTAWPQVTGSVEEDGLGFDYKWNMGWMNDFIGYMSNDPYFRGSHHNELTFSMIYAYSERFMLSLSHDEVVHGKASLLGKMPGEMEKKFANLRAAFGYFVTHPGKKLLFMGQEFAQLHEWAENRALDWEDLQQEPHRQMKEFVKTLIHLYKEYPALHSMDEVSEGFEWINCVEWDKSMVSFMRKTEKPEETLVVVCNFSDVEYQNFQLGVPYPGKYKEILNSDALIYGGSGAVNPRVKMAKKEECDGRPYSVKIRVAPLSASIFRFAKTEDKTADNKAAKRKRKMVSTRKNGWKQEIQEKMEQAEKEVQERGKTKA